MLTEDTICAISTAPGKRRNSHSPRIGQGGHHHYRPTVQSCKTGKTLTAAHSQTLTYGDIVDTDG